MYKYYVYVYHKLGVAQLLVHHKAGAMIIIMMIIIMIIIVMIMIIVIRIVMMIVMITYNVYGINTYNKYNNNNDNNDKCLRGQLSKAQSGKWARLLVHHKAGVLARGSKI